MDIIIIVIHIIILIIIIITTTVIIVFQTSIQSIQDLLVWRDWVRRLGTDPVVIRSSRATGPIRCATVDCWLTNPNKLNLLSWFLAYLSNK